MRPLDPARPGGDEFNGEVIETMNRVVALLASVAILGSAGCAAPPTKEQTGTVIGGALGGILGSQVGAGSGRTAAIIGGTIVGGMIGGSIGRYMDEQDRQQVQYALEANRTNQPTSWRNPDSGYAYTVTPSRTYETAEGPCREYTTQAVIGGKRETVYGTACRQSDGSWQARN